MDWTAIAHVVTSVGLVVVAVWGMYLHNKRRPPSLERALYQRRIKVVAEMNAFTANACRCARELLQLAEERNVDLLADLPSRDEGEDPSAETRIETEMTDEKKDEIEEKTRRIAELTRRLEEIGKDMDRALSRVVLFTPEPVVEPLLDCLDIITDIRNETADTGRLEELLGRRSDFLAAARKAIGASALSTVIADDLNELRERRRTTAT